MIIKVSFDGHVFDVECDEDSPLELLKVQIFSIIDNILPEKMELLRDGTLIHAAPETPLSGLGLVDGIQISVRLRADPPATPDPQPLATPSAQVDSTPYLEDLVSAQECCPRCFFGDVAIPQPGVVAEGRTVCLPCSSMCRQNLCHVLDIPAEPFVCMCRAIDADGCLFQERDDSHVAPPALLRALRAALEMRAQQLLRDAELKLRPHKERLRACLQSYLGMRRSYEDPAMQEEARAHIPTDEIHAAARTAVPAGTGLEYRDEVARQLLHWFKRTFKWVNEPPCDHCQGKTVRLGCVPPLPAEQCYGAGTVEAYRCTACQQTTRFPRYNHAGKLMQTRRGRCGEWAQAFCLCCVAMGFRARLVFDWTDHVWVEVHSEARGGWVHCDCCEDLWDAPLVYEAGWKKKLTYIVGFSDEGVADVTRRYTRHFADVLARRTELPESCFRDTIRAVDAQVKAALPLARREAALQRDREEAASLEGLEAPFQPPALAPAPAPAAEALKPEEQIGRLSGTAAGPQIDG